MAGVAKNGILTGFFNRDMLFLENYVILLLLLIYIASCCVIFINRYLIRVPGWVPDPTLGMGGVFRKKADTLWVLGWVEKTPP